MKKFLQTIPAIALLGFVLTIASCGGKEPAAQTDTERVQEILTSGTWKIQSVSVDGVDRTSDFANLQVIFNSGSFTATNGKLVWPATGTWSFTNDQATAFSRSDGVSVSIVEATDIRLVVELDWTSTTYGPGRVSSVAGEHTFTFTK